MSGLVKKPAKMSKTAKNARAGIQFPKAGISNATKKSFLQIDITEGMEEYVRGLFPNYDYNDDDMEDKKLPVNLDLLMGVYGDYNPTIEINNTLNTFKVALPDGMVILSISEQILRLTPAKQLALTAELMPHIKVVNFIDQLHDFKNYNDEIHNIIFGEIEDKNASEYAKSAIRTTEKIDVPKSHKVQQTTFDNINKILLTYNIIVPPIEPHRFVTRIGSTKLAYQESGRKGDREIDDGEDDGDDMDQAEGDMGDVSIQSKTVYAVVDGATHTGVNTLDIYNNLNRDIYNIDDTNNRHTLTILLFGDLVQAVINPYDTVGMNGIPDTSVTMTLTIMKGKHINDFVKIRLIGERRKSDGISLNSVLKVFELNESFPNAIRGKGDAPATFRIEKVSNRILPVIRNFLGLTAKTTCDQVLFSETDYSLPSETQATTSKNLIGSVLTVDGYVHAGIRANYLLGRMSELPDVYEMTKGGWILRPGISNMDKEIKDRFIRAVNLAVYFGIITIEPSNQYHSQTIVDKYVDMWNHYYESVKISQKIVNELTVSDNIFTFWSALLALHQASNVMDKIKKLKADLTTFLNNHTNVTNLFKIPHFESVLELLALDAAGRNQQSLITTSNPSLKYNLTDTEDADMIKFDNARIKAMNDGVIMPTNIMRDFCYLGTSVGTSVGGYDVATYAAKYYEMSAEDFCKMLETVDELSERAYIQSPKNFDIYSHLKLGSVISTVDVEANTVTFASLSKVSAELEAFYRELKEGDEEGGGWEYKYNTRSRELVGPLQYEILWILSTATLKREFETKRIRTIEIETALRMKVVKQYAEYLYDYFVDLGLKEWFDSFSSPNDDCKNWFIKTYKESIVDGVTSAIKKRTYKDVLGISDIPQFELSSIPEIDNYVQNSMRIASNESLPGKDKMGGKKKKNKNTRRIKKNIQRYRGKNNNKRKTVKLRR